MTGQSPPIDIRGRHRWAFYPNASQGGVREAVRDELEFFGRWRSTNVAPRDQWWRFPMDSERGRGPAAVSNFWANPRTFPARWADLPLFSASL